VNLGLGDLLNPTIAKGKAPLVISGARSSLVLIGAVEAPVG
jgi:hypothetical protein